MSEAIRNLALLVWAVCAINNNNTAHANMVVIGEEAPADGEVMVYGAAKNASGKTDEVLVEQPSANENPLGNPIVAPDDVAASVSAESVSPVAPVAEPAPDTSPRIEETLPQIRQYLLKRRRKSTGKFKIRCMNPAGAFMMFNLIRQAILRKSKSQILIRRLILIRLIN